MLSKDGCGYDFAARHNHIELALKGRHFRVDLVKLVNKGVGRVRRAFSPNGAYHRNRLKTFVSGIRNPLSGSGARFFIGKDDLLSLRSLIQAQ